MRIRPRSWLDNISLGVWLWGILPGWVAAMIFGHLARLQGLPPAYASLVALGGSAVALLIMTLLHHWWEKIGPNYSPRHPALLQDLAEKLARVKVSAVTTGAWSRMDPVPFQVEHHKRHGILRQEADQLVVQISRDAQTAEAANIFLRLCDKIISDQLHRDDTAKHGAELEALTAPLFARLHAGRSVKLTKLPLPSTAPEAPAPARISPPELAAQKMADPYRKAVLLLDAAPVTLSSNGEALVKAECQLRLTSKAPLQECSIWFAGLAGHENVSIDAFARTGRKSEGGFTTQFATRPNSIQPVYLIKRDLADIVSNPPFLLLTDKGEYPLQDNAEYFLKMELRSEAKYPTLVTLKIVTGVEEKLEVVIHEQTV